MSRLLILHEGRLAGRLDPLDLTRPVFLIRNGAWSTGERWYYLLAPDTVSTQMRAHLSRTAVAEATWLETKGDADAVDDIWIIVGAVSPTSDQRWDDLSLPHECAWTDGINHLLRLSRDQWSQHEREIREWLNAGATGACPFSDGESDLPLVGATGPWAFISHLADQLAFDASLWVRSHPESTIPDFMQGPESDPDGPPTIRCGEEVRIAAGALVDCTDGPVILDDGVALEPFTHLCGPAYIGVGTSLLGGKFSGGTAIGPGCKIGGEWEASIAQAFANKAHAGFFGHGFLGEWVNLGALTTNSDLKNNYGPVRLLRGDETIETGQMKVGAFIGDHTKTGIGTLIPTGAIIGTGSNVFGGTLCPRFVPSFTWSGPDQAVAYDLEKMIATAAQVVARRASLLTMVNRPAYLTDDQKEVLRKVFAETANLRRF